MSEMVRRGVVKIDWELTINRIFGDLMPCPRCSDDFESLTLGYSRKPSLNAYAPRHRNCPRGDECDARKLITLCSECSRSEGLHGIDGDAVQALEAYLMDCRRDLEESLDYLSEYWRDDYELTGDQVDAPLEEIDAEVFQEESQWRERLEDEYLRYHREFRDRHIRVPAAAWRSEYVEEIRSLGYETLLGD